MPVHDWTQVEAGIFHAFHAAWLPALQRALNDGVLPEGFYALAEQHAGRSIADVLTLHVSPASAPPAPRPVVAGGMAVAEAPPAVRRRQTVDASALAHRRSLAIRHVSGHRLVAVIEIVSPANKDRPGSVRTFVDKALDALQALGGRHFVARYAALLESGALRQSAAGTHLPRGLPWYADLLARRARREVAARLIRSGTFQRFGPENGKYPQARTGTLHLV